MNRLYTGCCFHFFSLPYSFFLATSVLTFFSVQVKRELCVSGWLKQSALSLLWWVCAFACYFALLHRCWPRHIRIHRNIFLQAIATCIKCVAIKLRMVHLSTMNGGNRVVYKKDVERTLEAIQPPGSENDPRVAHIKASDLSG